jgi:hypothetical protein
MAIYRNSHYPRCVKTMMAFLLVLIGTAATACIAQQGEKLPTVISASVPFYPRIAWTINVQGEVVLRVATDGEQVSSVEVVSGHGLLAGSAVSNVKTWRFEKHAAMTFEVTFHYKVLPVKCGQGCNCDIDGAEKDSVVLRLPTDVEINERQNVSCGIVVAPSAKAPSP